MARRMWRGVTRPFLLSLAALPANSNISAGGTEKQLHYQQVDVLKQSFISMPDLSLTFEKPQNMTQYYCCFTAVSLCFHCFKVRAHSFGGCGHFCLLRIFCQWQTNEHISTKMKSENQRLSWVTVSDSSCCLGANYALRREGWFTQMSEWMEAMTRSDWIV